MENQNKMVVFHYGDNSFAFDGEMMNATQMATPFGKRPFDFLRLESTEQYIAALEKRYGNSRNGSAIKVVQGGLEQGTWLDRKLAIRFAQWLNPDFAVSVDEQVENWLFGRMSKMPATQPLPLAGSELVPIVQNGGKTYYHGMTVKRLLGMSTRTSWSRARKNYGACFYKSPFDGVQYITFDYAKLLIDGKALRDMRLALKMHCLEIQKTQLELFHEPQTPAL